MQTVQTDGAPAVIGRYSQAVKSGGFVFCSGQIPLKPDGELVEGDVGEQVRQVMENLKAVLAAAGSSLGQVVKTTIYLADMEDFAVVNEVYGGYFEGSDPGDAPKPARATVEVARLPKDVKVEIDCVAEV